jgi:predicted dehydrogenase
MKKTKRTFMGNSEVSRRDFLKATGVTLAGAAISSYPVFAADTAPKKIRIGVVGGAFGSIFQWHLHPDCKVEAVSDLREDRRKHLAECYKCEKVYNSLEELVLDKNIDAVAIFTGAPDHVRHVELAMRHGKHVICAVPACFGILEDADRLLDIVKKTGLTYMMSETGYYLPSTLVARDFYNKREFGDLYYCEAEYQHPGLELLYTENGKRTWRWGMAPMHYPTHSTSQLVSVTGERLVSVVCTGWGDDSPCLKDNDYKNPFWNGSAMFKTDRGHSFRVNVWWKGAHMYSDRAQWIGSEMSYYATNPLGGKAFIVKSEKQAGKDQAGFARYESVPKEFVLPDNLMETLPKELQVFKNFGHEGAEPFLTHEFIDSLVHNRRPAVDIYEALSYTVPGIIAHNSALKGGETMKIPQYKRPA